MPKAVESKSHAMVNNDIDLNHSPLKTDVDVANLNNNLIPRGINFPGNDRIER